MIELTPTNVVAYLKKNGRLPESATAEAELLAWGVSNVVMRVSPATEEHLVVKQSREQLRTEAAWFSQLSRIWREADVMRVLGKILPMGAVPRILFEYRDNYVIGMEAIAADHIVWKEALLKREIKQDVAITAAGYLAAIHRTTANDADMADRFGDRTVFRELRVDPFYRALVANHAELSASLDALIAEMEMNAVCLVLADFSPKNILVTKSGVTLVDFETSHYGDPAFDLGFFLSHILLKAILHAPRHHSPLLDLAGAFWEKYVNGLGDAKSIEALEVPDLARRTSKHLAACTLARVDGTSRVDYLDDAKREQARSCGLAGLQNAFDDPVRMMRDWLQTD